jgi:hypothetical protein
MKTNEVTRRFVMGQVGVAVKMGRPGIGTSFRDIDRLTQAMACHGVEFEPNTPVTGLMTDPGRGILREDVLNERVLSAIIEFKLPAEKLAVILLLFHDLAYECKVHPKTISSLSLNRRGINANAKKRPDAHFLANAEHRPDFKFSGGDRQQEQKASITMQHGIKQATLEFVVFGFFLG